MGETHLIQYGPSVERKPFTISLGEFMLEKIKLYGDDVAQMSDVEGKEYTIRYSEILSSGGRVSRILTENGVEFGNTVMLCCGNTVEFAPIFFGIMLVGATCAPVNPTYPPADLAHMLEVTQPHLIICNPESLSNMREAVGMTACRAPVLAYEQMFEGVVGVATELRATPVPDPETHVALVMCSSGTTGKPKGVEITHAALLNVLARNTFPRSTVALCLYPPIWVTAIVMHVGFMTVGGKMVLMKEMHPKSVLECVQKYKVSYMSFGTQYLMATVRWPQIGEYDLSSIMMVGCGGTKLSKADHHFAESRLGVKITPTYGMTEAMRVTKPAWGRNDKPGSIGNLHDNFEAKVVDIESGELLGPNRQGELYFKGPTILKGYRGDPAATKALFDKDGFVITGDLGYYDEDGFFYVNDRIKDTIRYGKYWHLSSNDIEEVVHQHEGVAEAAVVGVPHDLEVERAAAFVVRAPGPRPLTAEDLSTFVRERLSERMWLHGGVFFVNQLPRTAAGKVRKHELRAMYVAAHPETE